MTKNTLGISTILVLFLNATTASAEETTPEPPRFLDGQQIECTGQASTPSYIGPCGSRIG